ncbi:hypothetical protein ACQP1U_03055 [Actinomycetota bacterium]
MTDSPEALPRSEEAPVAGGPPQRVRVTSSRRGALRDHSRPMSRELREQTGLGEVYLSGLMRAQLRLSLTVLGIVAVGLGAFPVLFLLVPPTRGLHVGPVPFPWLALGAAVYPVAWLVAHYYVRQSERIDDDFADVVSTS